MAGEASRKNGQKGGRPRGPSVKTLGLMKAVLRQRELTADLTIEQIRRGAFYDVRRLFDENGNLRPIKDLTEDEAMPIAGIEVVKKKDGDDWDTVVKVKLADRGRYVQMAAQLYALLKESKDVTHHVKPDLSKLSEAELTALEHLMRKADTSEAVH